jgi:hypothetical protein
MQNQIDANEWQLGHPPHPTSSPTLPPNPPYLRKRLPHSRHVPARRSRLPCEHSHQKAQQRIHDRNMLRKTNSWVAVVPAIEEDSERQTSLISFYANLKPFKIASFGPGQLFGQQSSAGLQIFEYSPPKNHCCDENDSWQHDSARPNPHRTCVWPF